MIHDIVEPGGIYRLRHLRDLTTFIRLHGATVDDDTWIQLAKIGFVGNLLVARKRPIGAFLLRDATVRTHYGILRCRKREDDLDVAYEGFERDILEMFTPTVGDTVVDCGAHIGKYTILASKLVGRQEGKVIALEPFPRTYQYLIANLKLNDCSNVTPMNCAAWNENEERTLWVSSLSSINSLNPSLGTSTRIGSVNVRCVRLDEILETIERIDWLKLDVEGADFEALQGLSESISKGKVRNIIVEASVQATLDFLKHHRYSLTHSLPSGYYYAHCEGDR